MSPRKACCSQLPLSILVQSSKFLSLCLQAKCATVLHSTLFKGAVKIKYKFIRETTVPWEQWCQFHHKQFHHFKQIIKILKKTYEAVMTTQLLSGDFSRTSQDFVCAIGDRRSEPPPENMSGRFLVPSYHIPRMLTCINTLVKMFLVLARTMSLLFILCPGDAKFEVFFNTVFTQS